MAYAVRQTNAVYRQDHGPSQQQRVSWGTHLTSHAASQQQRQSFMTDSGGFDSADFSNYEYSDSYDDGDDFRSPRSSGEVDSRLRYSDHHRGYGYQPHYVGPRDSYESYLSRGSSGPYYRESTDRDSYNYSYGRQRYRDSADTNYYAQRSSAGYSSSYRASADYRRGAMDRQYGSGQYDRSADYSSYVESAEYSRSQYSGEYSSYGASSEFARQAHYGGHRQPHVRHSAAITRSSAQSAGAESHYVPPSRPFKHAWERTRDELCEAAREELGKHRGNFEAVPEWVRRAIERKEAAEKLERAKLRTSDARFAAMLEGTERELANEQRRLQAIADERADLEAQRKRLELHRRAKELVPESTYDPHPPPVTFPWTEENKDQMHKLCLARYDQAAKERRRAAKTAEMQRQEAEAEREKAAYTYDAEFYWLDKGPAGGALSSRAADGRALASPTWSDVAALKRRNRAGSARHARVAGPQGKTVVLR